MTKKELFDLLKYVPENGEIRFNPPNSGKAYPITGLSIHLVNKKDNYINSANVTTEDDITVAVLDGYNA